MPTSHLGEALEVSSYRSQIDQLAKVIEGLDCSWQIIKTTQDAVHKKFHGLLNQETSTHFLVELDNLIQVFPINYSDPNRLRTLINVLLKHQLEYLWYQDFPVYADPTAVAMDSQLLNLRSSQHKYQIKFGFTVLREDIFHKFINPLKRKFRIITNHPAQGTVGMKITKCKPEMLALLNEITQQSTQNKSHPHRLQINSILRTVDHQKHLASLGYWAPPTSSHTTGYAADIEQLWYWQKDPILFKQIQLVLNRYYQEGIINLIDEGKVWHICLNPQFRELYLQKSQLWLKG
ncbi:MAG: hypothetical protein HC916_03645 [Coleofasciculaceae cyanobacterium SM2_1_6]|nr:hypothetical protein [Coleofasciculaceae cyanobacterium SM2_1_6]